MPYTSLAVPSLYLLSVPLCHSPNSSPSTQDPARSSAHCCIPSSGFLVIALIVSRFVSSPYLLPACLDPTAPVRQCGRPGWASAASGSRVPQFFLHFPHLSRKRLQKYRNVTSISLCQIFLRSPNRLWAKQPKRQPDWRCFAEIRNQACEMTALGIQLELRTDLPCALHKAASSHSQFLCLCNGNVK